jgi:tetratricopeptide (TPR) repeat protein
LKARSKRTKEQLSRGSTELAQFPRKRKAARKGRIWVFRLLALTLAPLLLLGMLEGALRIVGYGYSPAFFRTIMIDGKPVVVENEQFSERFFPQQLVRRPLPLSFTPRKPADTYRIFVLGESAAMGDPEPAYAFGRILEVLLSERFPAGRFEVVNLAFTAINSHVILPIARESAQQEADLWVVYMGHNEVQGPFGPGTVFGGHRSSLWLIRSGLALKKTKIGQAVQALHARFSSGADQAGWRGLNMFLENQLRRDDPRLTAMYAHFQRNLDDILRAAQSGGAAVLLCTPASNLKDSPPFASLHSPGLDEQVQAAWNELIQEGTAAAEDDPEAAGALYRAAIELDPQHAELHFRMGGTLLRSQKPQEARLSFEQARDLDTLRFRADGRLIQIIDDTARRWQHKDVFFCDTRAEMAQYLPDSIPGDEFFFDHVHLTYAGNYVLARSMAEQISRLLPASWRGTDTGRWPAYEACARRLALTDWNQYQMHEMMQRRLLEAPFSDQSNHSTRQQGYIRKLIALRPALRPESFEASAEVYRQALDRAPSDPLLHLNFAKLLAAAGRDDDALAQFRRVAQLWPQHPAAFHNIGLLLHKQGKLAEAEQHFHFALERRPGLADALNGLGLIRAAKGDLPGAIASYRRAIRSNPILVEARVNLAHALQQQGKAREAEEQYRHSLEINPRFAPAHWGLGDLLLKEAKTFEAISHLAEAARLQPENTLARASHALGAMPSNPIEHFKMANVLAALDRTNEAMASLQSAINLKTNFWEARYLLGVELATQDRLPEAQEQFTAVVALHPEYPRGHLNLGVALARQLQFDAAATHFHEALRLEPTNQSAQHFLENIRAMTNATPSTAPIQN